jgi:hypothetical protein
MELKVVQYRFGIVLIRNYSLLIRIRSYLQSLLEPEPYPVADRTIKMGHEKRKILSVLKGAQA